MNVKSVLQLNDSAIACLRQNDYRGAIRLLKDALDTLRQLSLPQDNSASTLMASIEVIPLGQQDSLQVLPETGEVNVAQPLQVLAYYANDCDDDRTDTTLRVSFSQQDTQVCMTALLFNLGLCLHRQALFSLPMYRNNRGKNLAKAASFYRWAMTHAVPPSPPPPPPPPSSSSSSSTRQSCPFLCHHSSTSTTTAANVVVATALGNNLCSILASSFYEWDDLDHALEWTESYLANATAKAPFFLGNALFWRQARHKPAAAA